MKTRKGVCVTVPRCMQTVSVHLDSIVITDFHELGSVSFLIDIILSNMHVLLFYDKYV